MRNGLAGAYELTINLDFNEDDSYASGVVNNAYRPLDKADPTDAPVVVKTQANAGDGLNPGFIPFANFTGTFEGNGFTINNLYINAGGGDTGLFISTTGSASIRNLGLINVYINSPTTAGSSIGTLVGYKNGGTITNCYASGTINAPSTSTTLVGGLVGFNSVGAITNCYASTNVSNTTDSGTKDLGGLVGRNASTISNCYATGTVTAAPTEPGTGTNAGGLVGQNSGGTITNSYATGAVSGAGTKGGLSGSNSGTITNCYFDSTTTGQSAGIGGGTLTGVTSNNTTELQALLVEGTATAPADRWSTNDWDFGDNTQYPALRTYKENDSDVQIQGITFCDQPTPRAECPLPVNADGISEISTIEELNLVRKNLAGNYLLINDLDFADGPIAYRPSSVVSPTDASTVVANTAGVNPGFTPIGEDLANRFTGSFDGNGFTISNLYINATTNNVGLFGLTGMSSEMKNLGLVNAYVKGKNSTGGLAGTSNGITIRNCYVTGTVEGVDFVGGLVGANIGIISNCYSAATVSGIRDIGGVIGNHNGTIDKCYATGAVSGTNPSSVEVGGLVGYNGEINNITNCYWDTETTGQAIGIGGAGAPQTGTIGKITMQMQALTGADIPESVTPDATTTQSGWGTNDWDFGTDSQYPTLRSYVEIGSSQIQGFIICNQPTATHIQCNATTPVLQARVSSINFGGVTTATTLQLVITGRNLSGEITLSGLTAPFAYAAGQTPTLAAGSGGFVSASIPVTFTPTSMAQAHASTITFSGGGLSTNVEIALTGVSVPPLAEVNGSLEINYIEQLNLVRNDLDADYKLTRNLDFANDSHYASGAVNLAYRPLNNANPTAPGATVQTDPAMGLNPGWVPIGDNSDDTGTTNFTGTLDGNDFTISNLYVNITTATAIYAGLFGVTNTDSEVQNLGLLDVYVKVSGGMSGSMNIYVGGLVGWSRVNSITNCYVTGTVTTTGPRNHLVGTGGLVGGNFDTTISNCYTTATVSGEGNRFVYTGGLIGHNNTGSVISNCYATGDVTATIVERELYTGGLVGWSFKANINNCYATGDVTGTGAGSSISTGGLVGESFESPAISNCYATGTATGTGTGSGDVNTGGLIGGNSSSTITNCYATGTATGTGSSTNTGGLVGNNSGTITNCFFEATATDANTGALTQSNLYELNVEGTSTTPAERWSTNDWDFGTTSQYPALRTYKTDDAAPAVQIQGDLICPQPQPRTDAECPSISITTTPQLTNNTYDFGTVETNAPAMLTYTITGERSWMTLKHSNNHFESPNQGTTPFLSCLLLTLPQ